jgi:hypothetical protein
VKIPLLRHMARSRTSVDSELIRVCQQPSQAETVCESSSPRYAATATLLHPTPPRGNTRKPSQPH